MSLPTKKKSKKSLPLSERVKAINMYENLRSTRKLASIFNCSASQIKYILQRKELYLEEWERKSQAGAADPTSRQSKTKKGIISKGYTEHYGNRSRLQNYEQRIPLTDDSMHMPMIKAESLDDHEVSNFLEGSIECNEADGQESNKIDVNSYEEAYTLLGHLERFALDQGDVDGLCLVNALENYFMSKMQEY